MIKDKSHLYDAEALGRLFGKLVSLTYLEELMRRAKVTVIVYKNEAGRPQVWLWRN